MVVCIIIEFHEFHLGSIKFSFDALFSIAPEDGLKKAQQVTAALYDGDFEALSSLSVAEMKSIFAGATIHNVMLESGMTVLDLALKAKIYKHDRKSQPV